MITKEQFAKMQDHSILGTYCSREEVRKACEEVLRHGFAAVYVNPCEVSFAKSVLGSRAAGGHNDWLSPRRYDHGGEDR